jgi:hypothetical protein
MHFRKTANRLCKLKLSALFTVSRKWTSWLAKGRATALCRYPAKSKGQFSLAMLCRHAACYLSARARGLFFVLGHGCNFTGCSPVSPPPEVEHSPAVFPKRRICVFCNVVEKMVLKATRELTLNGTNQRKTVA